MSYILILVIPVLIFSLIYGKTVKMVEDDVKRNNLLYLEESRRIIDQYLEEIDVMVKRLVLNPKIVSLIYTDSINEGSTEVCRLIDAQNYMSVYRMTNSFVKELLLYCKKNDAVITTQAANTRMKLLYGNYFTFGNMSYKEWKENIVQPYYYNKYISSTPILLKGKTEHMITFIQSLPLEYPRQDRGCVMVFIDTNAVNQLLSIVNTGENGWVYIVDESDNIITSVSSSNIDTRNIKMVFDKPSGVMNTRISGRNMIVSYTVSKYNGWKYVAAVPTSFVMTKVNYIKYIVICFTVISLITGLVLAFVFSYRNSKPVTDLVNMIRKLTGESYKYKNEFVYLKGSISGLIRSNEDLQKKVNQQMPLIKAEFFRRLLKGSYNNLEEINSHMAQFGVQIKGRFFSVLIIRINGYGDIVNSSILKELDVIRIIVRNILETKFESNMISYDLDKNKIAVLLQHNSDNNEHIQKKVNDLAESLYNEFYCNHNIRISIASGNIYKSIKDIGFSLSEASQTLEYASLYKDKVISWYNEIPTTDSNYNYSMEVETKLINIVKYGDVQEVENVLNNIYYQNFSERKLPSHISNLLMQHMLGTLLRLCKETHEFECANNILMKINQVDSTEVLFENIKSAFCELCQQNKKQKSKSDDILKQRIEKYLQSVYMKNDLTLYDVAQEFKMTETYLYHFFKNKLGISFACYLEKLRIDNALVFLKETGITVREVAEKTGYNSVHSFRRAFKKCVGSIPSNLRED